MKKYYVTVFILSVMIGLLSVFCLDLITDVEVGNSSVASVCGAEVIDEKILNNVVLNLPDMKGPESVDIKMFAVSDEEKADSYCWGKEALSFARNSPNPRVELILYNRDTEGIIIFLIEENRSIDPESGKIIKREAFTLFLFGKNPRDPNEFAAMGLFWEDSVTALNELFDKVVIKAVPFLPPQMIPFDFLMSFMGEATAGQFSKFRDKNKVSNI